MNKIGQTIYSLILPGLFILVWIFIATGVTPFGAQPTDTFTITALKWMLSMAGWVFLVSSLMHSVFAKTTAASIGWVSNGFQYELAMCSLGLGLGCLYAIYHSVDAWIAISIPVILFLFLAAVNHLIEIIRSKNYAPNNTFILIWDFGISISLAALLLKL